MSIKHRIYLIIPKFRWLRKMWGNILKQWRRLRTTIELREKRKELLMRYIELKRKNTDESNEEAYGVRKQVELLVWILGGNGNGL